MLGGAQGVLTTGTHGAGVNTPDAAAVAAWTAGFAGLVHIPKELMFTPTAKSWIVAIFIAGVPMAAGLGTTVRAEGDIPKEQASIAPVTTGTVMNTLVSSSFRKSRSPADRRSQ